MKGLNFSHKNSNKIEADDSRLKQKTKKSGRPHMKANIWDGSLNIRQKDMVQNEFICK